MVSSPIFRFAPSPNGLLHMGHAYSALYSYQAAQAVGGEFLVRIEDFDTGRARGDHIAQIFDDLAWLGLSWSQPVRYQSQHMADYASALARLEALGVTYKCFASRSEIKAEAKRLYGEGNEPRDPDGATLYPGICRGLSEGELEALLAEGKPSCTRLDMKKACELIGHELSFVELNSGPNGERGQLVCQPCVWGDVIIARKEVPASYHLCVVVDDAIQGVTCITRGQDLFHATSVHRVLQCLLELPEPEYSHHALVLDGAGRKLAKSAMDKSLKSLRAEGLQLDTLKADLKHKGL